MSHEIGELGIELDMALVRKELTSMFYKRNGTFGSRQEGDVN